MFNYSFNDIYLKKWPQIFSYGYYAVNHNMTFGIDNSIFQLFKVIMGLKANIYKIIPVIKIDNISFGIIILFFIMLSYCIIPVHFKELWMKYKNEMLSFIVFFYYRKHINNLNNCHYNK